MDLLDWPYRLKSARRKKRLVKKDRDKQLLKLDRRETELMAQRRALPLIELETPYQRGWKRSFTLRDDVKRSSMADFYAALLPKINTVEYHHDPSFKRKKRRKKRYGYQLTTQSLREFWLYNWNLNRFELSEQEKACFTRVETFDIRTRRTDIKYVFTEPWHYVLKVEPRLVTHKKLGDTAIEKELAQIRVHIDNHFLSPRINRLIRGRSYRWSGSRDFERIKYINEFKNIPRNANKDAYPE